MADINLLPYDNRRGLPSFLAVFKKSFRILVGGSLILLVIALLSYAGTYYLQSKIDESKQNQEKLTSQIRSLQGSEQKLVLIKDRLDKVRTIQRKDMLVNAIMKVFDFNQQLPSTTLFNGMSLKLSLLQNSTGLSQVVPEQATLSYAVTSSDEVRQLVDRINAFNDLKTVQFDGFSYTPTAGYVVNLEIITKK